MESGAVVVAFAELSGAGVQGHPYLQEHLPFRRRGRSGGLESLQALLSGERGVESVSRLGEGGTESVSHRLEDVASVGLDGGPEAAIVAGQGSLHGRGVLLPELRAAPNVREQERDGSRRQFTHW